MNAAFARYVAVGVWNTVFGYGLYAGLTHLLAGRFAYSYVAASVGANLIAITVAFVGYKRIVFRSGGSWWREYLRCVGVYSGGLVAGVVLLPLLVALMGGLGEVAPYAAGAVLTAGTVVASFFGHRHFTFKN